MSPAMIDHKEKYSIITVNATRDDAIFILKCDESGKPLGVVKLSDLLADASKENKDAHIIAPRHDLSLKYAAVPPIGAMGDDLPGLPTTLGGTVKCRECGTDNFVQFLDRCDPPTCQNGASPKHKLRWWGK